MQGDVHAWGRGEGGRLGTNSEEDACSPQEMEVDTTENYFVNVKCSGDATILLSDKGQVKKNDLK